MAVGVRQRHKRGCRGGRCGCSWEAFVYSRLDGRKLRKTFPTQSAAREWRAETIVAVRRMLIRARRTPSIEVAGEAWLEKARQGLIRTRSGDPYKPATLRSYEMNLRMRVTPRLGAKRLSEVTRNDVQDLVDALVTDGHSAASVVGAVSALRVIYKRALTRGEVAINPVTGVQVPAVRGRRNRVATPEECARLLMELPARDRGVWATAMYAGLRRGELMALRIDDIDLDREVITVSRGWDALEGEISTKSGRVRVVPVSEVLRAHLVRHLSGLPWDEGLVFGIGPGRPFNSTPLAKRAERAWNAVQLPRITLHECRHTFASLMIAAGVNGKALSTYMGHANISITMDRYGHLMPGNEREAAAMLDSYLHRDAPDTRQPWPALTPGGPSPAGPRSSEEAVARLIAIRRRALGLTREQLASRAHVAPSLISSIEGGRELPSVRVLGAIAAGLETNLVFGLEKETDAARPSGQIAEPPAALANGALLEHAASTG